MQTLLMSLNQEIMYETLAQSGFERTPDPIEFAVPYAGRSVLARIARTDGTESAEVLATVPEEFKDRGVSATMPQEMDGIANVLLHTYGFGNVRYVPRP